MSLIKPSYMFSNVNIDKNNSLTRGLVAAYTRVGNNFYDVVGNTPTIVQSSTFDEVNSTIGSGFITSSTGQTVVDGGKPQQFTPSNKKFSVYTLFSRPNESTTATIISQRDLNDTANAQYNLKLSGGLLLFQLGSNPVTLLIGNDAFPNDTIRDLSFSVNGNNVRGYSNGKFLTQTDFGATTISNNLTNVGIGGGWKTYPARGDFVTKNTSYFLACIWNRTLNDGEFAELHLNPWQLFERPHKLYLFKPTNKGALIAQNASISGTGFKTAFATGSLVSDSPTIAVDGGRLGTATGALTAANSSTDGAGFKTAFASGTLDSNISTINGVGINFSTGTGALVADVITLTAGGGRLGTGIVALSSGISALSGVGFKTSVVNISLEAQSVQVSGTGFKTTVNTANLISQESTLDIVGGRFGTGTGSLVSNISQIDGIGNPDAVIFIADRTQRFNYSPRRQSYIEE